MNLRQNTIRGLTWSGVSQVISQGCQFVITAILAHLLSPNDFGLLGMAAVFTGFAAIFSDMGISGAIIQNQEIDERHYSSAFWLNVLVGVVLTVAFILLSPAIARFYSRAELIPILTVLSINFFLSSFTIIQQAILTKGMNFKSLALRDILAVVISGAAGIFCAYHGYGLWSLVIQLLTYTVINNLSLWFSSPWRPKWILDFSSLRQILPFSSHVTGFQVINYFARNIDNLLIGKVLGSQALGYYSLAYKLMMFPIQNFTWVITRVMFPAFSKIQDQVDKVRRNYLLMVKAVALVSFPLMAYLFVTASDLIQLVYGDAWHVAVPVVRIFCFCGMVQSITSLGGTIYLSKGRADLQLMMIVISTSSLSIILYVAVHNGIEMVAFAYTIFYSIWANLSIFITAKLISLSVSKLYRIVWAPFAFSMTLIIVSLGLSQVIHLGPLSSLVFFGVIGFGMYAILILWTKQVTLKGNRQFSLGEVKG